MNSILQTEKECLLCGRKQGLDKHHVFFGAGLKEISEQYGLTVWLCHNEHHIFGENSVHKNPLVCRSIQRWAQAKAMKHYHWNTEQFISIFRKNYL